jgi:hypothetical protein
LHEVGIVSIADAAFHAEYVASAILKKKEGDIMKVICVIRRSPAKRFLVELHTNKLVKEVSDLVAKRRNSKAIVTALSKGRFEKEIKEGETGVKADIILTEESVHYDLMGR